MATMTLVGEPDETERQAWVMSGLEQLECHANGGVEQTIDVGRGVQAIYDHSFNRGVGRVATGFIIPQKRMPRGVGNGQFEL